MIATYTDWSGIGLITGMGIGVVFLILILLVLILYVFHHISETSQAAAVRRAARKGQVTPIDEASEIDKAAVATALHLYLNAAHDEESGVLTVAPTRYTPWHGELNHRLWAPSPPKNT